MHQEKLLVLPPRLGHTWHEKSLVRPETPMVEQVDELPKLILRSTPSLPRRSVSISTQCLFHVISRPIRLVGKKPLFTLSG